VTTGGVWTNASSREYKEDITTLGLEEALEALQGLEPVKYKYKVTRDERHVGFIAEDVPELVATEDRKSLSPMDIAAVLTRGSQDSAAADYRFAGGRGGTKGPGAAGRWRLAAD